MYSGSTQKQVNCLGAVRDRLVFFQSFVVFFRLSFYRPPSFPSSFLLAMKNPSIFFLVRQLHREFQRAGADVIQAFTFSLDDDWEGDHAKYGVCIITTLSYGDCRARCPKVSAIDIDLLQG